MSICNHCFEDKLEMMPRRNTCKDCFNKQARGYHQKNKESKNSKRRENSKLNYEAGICKQCKQKRLAISRFCALHYIMTMLAVNTGVNSVISARVLLKRLEDQGYRCPYTNEVLVLGVNASLDHVLPRSRFPQHRSSIDNLEWISDKANHAKSSMTKEEFLSLCHTVAMLNPLTLKEIEIGMETDSNPSWTPIRCMYRRDLGEPESKD